jgi:hypothetical protein
VICSFANSGTSESAESAISLNGRKGGWLGRGGVT